MRRVGRSLLIALAMTLLPVPVAGARGSSSASAPPPTLGALYRDGQSGRYLLGGDWLYRADPTDAGVSQGWWKDLGASTGWSSVTVPSSFNAGDFSVASMIGSVGWYRRDFTIPARAFASYVPSDARRWIVRFESVNYRATVWLNGHRIGSHTGAFLPFEFDLGALRSGVNRLVVRVDDRHGLGDFPPGPAGGWWNFGGLLREVYLRAVQEADVSRVQIHTLLPCPTCSATIAEQVVVRNPTSHYQAVHLTGHYGKLALDFGSARIMPRAAWTASASAVLTRPRLWSPDRPYLYEATLSLTDAKGRPLAGYVTYSGVRSIAVDAEGRLTLNGRLLHLRGVALHEQDLSEGAALDSLHLRRLVEWAKQLGATIIRAHYPLNPQIEELADREGILLWSEIPVYQAALDYLGDPTWLAQAHQMLQDNIFTNQNHPSVLTWSIGNELTTPAPAGEVSYIANAAALAHKLDPTRPVSMAISAWPGIACQAAYAPLDVIGFNDYFGWYDAGAGATDDRDGLSPFLDVLHACYPFQPLFVTEFGFEANRTGPIEERGTYAFQSDNAAFHLSAFSSKSWLAGAIYFALQDFAVTPGWTGGNPLADPPFHHKGLIDLFGKPKPAFSVVSRIFHATQQISSAASSARSGRGHGSF